MSLFGAAPEIKGWGLRNRFTSPAAHYGVSALFVGLAALVHWGLAPYPFFGVYFVFVPFFLALLISTFVGGWKPGLLAMVLSVVAAQCFFTFVDSHSRLIDPLYPLQLMIFLFMSGLTIGLGEMQRMAQRRAEVLVGQLRTEIILHQQTESKLTASEESYRSLFENNLDAVFTLDLAGFFVTANPAAVKLSGYSLAELQQMTFAEFCPAEHLPVALRHFELAVRGTPHPSFELRMISKEGRSADLVITGGPVKVKGRIVGAFSIATDVTERKRADKHLAAFSKMGQRLSSARTPVEAGRIIGDLAEELFGWDAFSLNLYSLETNQADYILNVDTFNGQKIENLPFPEDSRIPACAHRIMLNGPELILNPADACELVPFCQCNGGSDSFMFVPIRDQAKTIGVLSIQSHLAGAYDENDLRTLQSLADYCSGALQRLRAEEELRHGEEENRRLNTELELRVMERTRQLEFANQELEAFAYAVSHDLRAPLRSVGGFAEALKDDYEDRLDEDGRDYLNRVIKASHEMESLIVDLLHLSRLSRAEMKRLPVNLSALAHGIVTGLREREPRRRVEFAIAPGLVAPGDPQLMRIALENLLSNAWKFTGRRPAAQIEFGMQPGDGEAAYYVRDNGAGFDMAFAHKLFGAFQRLHNDKEFPGHGIGLATVQRIINRHGGKTWAMGEVDNGAAFFFTLPT
ncbi:MAG: fgrK [Pedosphaera sp.]|nr:fgrK [Pedosphaera sp.]